MKVDLSVIEKPFKSGRFIDDEWETKIKYGELRLLIDVVRAAKELFDFCEHNYMDKTELTMLRGALSKIEFGDKDD